MLSKSDAKRGQEIVKRVSRKHDGDDHGSSAWKVAFADFCLALMCLFLVLWVMAASKAEKLAEMKQGTPGGIMDEGVGRRLSALGGPRGSLIDRLPIPSQGDTIAPRRKVVNGDRDERGSGELLAKRRLESPAELYELSEVVKRLTADAGLAGHITTLVTPQGLRIMLHDTDQQGMFARASAMPSDRFRALLRKMGPLFAQIENQMLILGHTDALPYADVGRSAYSNWSLSNDRAMSARLNLLAGGMRSDSVLQVVGMADRAPLDVSNPRAGVNRRIELLVLTSANARNLAAMFGVPDAVSPLIDGVDASAPRADAQELLRLGELPAAPAAPRKAAEPSTRPSRPASSGR